MRLLKKTLIYSLGNFGAKGITMLFIPFLTFYLTKEELGKYDLTLVTVHLFIPILSLQLSESLFRWLISDGSSNNRIKVITNIYSYYFIVIFLSIILYLIGNYLFINWFTCINFIFLFTQLFYLLTLQTARAFSFNKLYAFSGFLSSFLLVVTSILLIKFTSLRVNAVLISSSISYCIISLIIISKIRILQYYKIHYLSFTEIKNLLKYSLPLVPNALSWWGISMATRYVILAKLGIENNGLYAVSTKIPALIIIMTSFFTLAWQEEVITQDESENLHTSIIFKNYYTLLLSSVFILLPASQFLLKIAVSPAFFESWKYIYFLLLSAVFHSLSAFLGAYYLKSKKTKKLFSTSMLSFLISLLFAFLLVDKFALHAISFSTFVGMFTMFTTRMIETKISTSISNDFIKISSLIAISFLLFIFLLNNVDTYIVLLAGISLFFLINYKNIFYIFHKYANEN